MTDKNTPGPTVVSDADLRKLASQFLNALALAALLAAGTVFALMVAGYAQMEEYDRDWPGRYWYAVLPLLVVATSLAVAAWRFETADERVPRR